MRARLLSGAATPILGKAAGGGDVAIGTIQFFEADPGAGWLKCDGRPYTPTSHPALYGTIPANLSQPTQFGQIGGLDVQPTSVLAAPLDTGTFFAHATNSGALANIGYTSGVASGFSNTGTGLSRAKLVNGFYYAIINSGRLARSVSGFGSWAVMTLASDARDVNDLAFGNGIHVAVGGQGTVWTSTTGADGTWTQRATPTGSRLFGVAFGAGLFVAVGANGAMVTSPNGIAWTNTPRASGGDIYGIAYGNGSFTTVGADGTKYFLNSANGVDWASSTSSTPGILSSYYNVKFSCGMFIACRFQTFILTSPDGKVWNRGPSVVSGLYNQPIDADIANDGTFAASAYYPDGQGLTFFKGSVLSMPLIGAGLTQKGKVFTPYMKAA